MPHIETGAFPIKISPQVKHALTQKAAVLAMESTVITHGLPYPENLSALKILEESALQNGACPATICLFDGIYHIGLDEQSLATLESKLVSRESLVKVASRDLAMAAVKKLSGGTTVSATMALAHSCGIRVFATGGIGGVHRAWQGSLDISLDIKALSSIPVIVVCAGCKAILDIPATIEALESAGVPVYAWQTDEFPSFYSRESGVKAERVNSTSQIAECFKLHNSFTHPATGMLIANPIPAQYEIPKLEIEPYIQKALEQAKGLKGKEITPFLLEELSKLTHNKSVKANLALLENNVALGARIAGDLA